MNEVNKMTYENELYHYGVLGMKWGRRKQRTVDTSGRKAQFKKMTDAQRRVYARNRVKYAGSKQAAKEVETLAADRLMGKKSMGLLARQMGAIALGIGSSFVTKALLGSAGAAGAIPMAIGFAASGANMIGSIVSGHKTSDIVSENLEAIATVKTPKNIKRISIYE